MDELALALLPAGVVSQDIVGVGDGVVDVGEFG